jgi:hypothetical protein
MDQINNNCLKEDAQAVVVYFGKLFLAFGNSG